MDALLNQILAKTERIKTRYEEIGELISAPEIIADNKLYRKLALEHVGLEETVFKHDKLKKYLGELKKCEKDLSLTDNVELKELLTEEIKAINIRINKLVEEIKLLLLPKDDKDNRNAVLEIKAENSVAGAFFAHKLLKMYQMYAQNNSFEFNVTDFSYSELGGLKFAVVDIAGGGAYAKLRYESGLHKAVGIEEGRAKTGSYATVSVLPEIEDIEVEIKEKDIRMDVFHSGGAGGQNVNKVETAVRITHFPTSITVTCQDERSQLKNKERAIKILRSKLFDYYKKERDENYNKIKKSLLKNNKKDSLRIYNFLQNTVTDNRVNLTLSLGSVLDGMIDNIIDAVIIKEKDKLLAKTL